MEECVLGLVLVNQILDVIDDKCVDALVKVDELIDLTVAGRYRELALEQPRAYIQYACKRIVFFYLDSYRLNQVGLADSGGTENEQWVECFQLGVIGDGLTNRAGDFI